MNAWQSKKYIVTLSAVAILLGIAIFLVPSGRFPFLPTKRVSAPSDLPGVAPAKTETLSSKKSLPIEIIVPEGAGHIVEGLTAKEGSDKVIIHIQDIHTNYEAQKNLSRILETLIKANELKLIMVEGGWGNVSLSYLRSHAGKERRLEVGEEYLKAGKISGEEYLDIISDHEIELEGLEDEALYRANLDTFFKIEQFREKAAKELDAIELIIKKLKEKIYPQQLLGLEKAKKSYEDEKISLADYYKEIDLLAHKTGQSLAHFPNFANFIEVTKSEKAIDFPKVEKERSTLIERLSKKLSKQKLTALVTKSLEFRLSKLTPSEYHSYLVGEAKSAGEDLNSYPNLQKYVDYIRSHEDIDTAQLFEEAEALATQVKDKLITNTRQKRLNEISTAADVLNNFLQLKLVPKDFKYYKENKTDFITANWIGHLKKEAKRNKVRATRLKPAYVADKNLSTLVQFYDIADERDDVFVRNAIKLMNEKDQNLAVLIAGGFHTPSLKQKLKECGISYIIVAPHTTEQTDPELYRYILKYKSGKEE